MTYVTSVFLALPVLVNVNVLFVFYTVKCATVNLKCTKMRWADGVPLWDRLPFKKSPRRLFAGENPPHRKFLQRVFTR